MQGRRRHPHPWCGHAELRDVAGCDGPGGRRRLLREAHTLSRPPGVAPTLRPPESIQAAGDLPEFDLPPVVVEKPREAGHGDYASPVAMVLARYARMAPLKIAEIINKHLLGGEYLEEITVAAPGFINFRLSPGFLQNQVDLILLHPPLLYRVILLSNLHAYLQTRTKDPEK